MNDDVRFWLLIAFFVIFPALRWLLRVLSEATARVPSQPRPVIRVDSEPARAEPDDDFDGEWEFEEDDDRAVRTAPPPPPPPPLPPPVRPATPVIGVGRQEPRVMGSELQRLLIQQAAQMLPPRPPAPRGAPPPVVAPRRGTRDPKLREQPPHPRKRSVAPAAVAFGRLSPMELRRVVQGIEVLGPPRALQPFPDSPKGLPNSR